jgi:hypothetical protein
LIEPHTHDRERRTSQCVVCVFVSFACLWVGGWVCVCACVRAGVGRKRGAWDYSFGGWRGVGRDRVLHLRRCGVCVRLGAPGWGRGRLCAGACWCVLVCSCVCVLGGGAALAIAQEVRLQGPTRRTCAPSLPSVCLPACRACPACLQRLRPPPPSTLSAEHQPRTRRAPAVHQAEVRAEVGLKSGGCRPELGRAAAAHRAGGRTPPPSRGAEASPSGGGGTAGRLRRPGAARCVRGSCSASEWPSRSRAPQRTAPWLGLGLGLGLGLANPNPNPNPNSDPDPNPNPNPNPNLGRQ